MVKSYIEVSVLADEELSEKLAGIFAQLGFEGFWEDTPALRCYISSDRWSPALMRDVESIASLVARSSISVTPKIFARTLQNQNWNEKWEKTIRPIQVSERIVIAPTWHEYKPLPGQIVLTIDPKMSFGTGYHESTRLVLKLLERHLSQGMRVLDVGTGTGVLALAALKLGASSAVAVDNDEWSYDNALENMRLNHVEGRLKIIHGEIASVPPSTFDLILANIQRSVIEGILDEMKELLAGNGLLLLSGLLVTDREAILRKLQESGFSVEEEMAENEWIAVAARRTEG
jgi:ribosomal protein L11 methyltransferase